MALCTALTWALGVMCMAPRSSSLAIARSLVDVKPSLISFSQVELSISWSWHHFLKFARGSEGPAVAASTLERSGEPGIVDDMLRKGSEPHPVGEPVCGIFNSL